MPWRLRVAFCGESEGQDLLSRIMGGEDHSVEVESSAVWLDQEERVTASVCTAVLPDAGRTFLLCFLPCV
jgi:hypothetical protein